jgi:hypothetical protein
MSHFVGCRELCRSDQDPSEPRPIHCKSPHDTDEIEFSETKKILEAFVFITWLNEDIIKYIHSKKSTFFLLVFEFSSLF